MDNLAETIYTIATWLVPLAFAIVFHEVAHGYVARHYGDPTAANLGRLTLNPVKHIDPIGTVALPTFLAVIGAPIFGWAKPVPVIEQRLRNPRWDMVKVAAAGPASNIALGIIASLVTGLFLLAVQGSAPTPVTQFLFDNLRNFIIINVFLAVFNMLPLPPFDGSKVLAGFLPPALAEPYKALDRFGFLFLLLLILLVPRVTGVNVVSAVILPPVEWIMGVMGQIIAVIAG
ncbi:site-2 protease family protein [Pseudonocardia sp. TMWB2A]|uniref:site-2 protease family protein n=1 Tax=Pseudonocardia sp. TMWB2A TaxID=687430 RepID=UPI00307EC364